MVETHPEKRRIGYAHVSTVGQTLDSQLEQLCAAGCSSRNIYREKVTGARADRRELNRMLGKLALGDVVMVTRINRLGPQLPSDGTGRGRPARRDGIAAPSHLRNAQCSACRADRVAFVGRSEYGLAFFSSSATRACNCALPGSRVSSSRAWRSATVNSP